MRKLDAQRYRAFGARPLLVVGELVFGVGVEIARGKRRINIALPRKKPGDVAQIFPLQRQRVVFRMPLEEDEMAAQPLGEDIDAGLPRFRQQLIAARGQVALVATR